MNLIRLLIITWLCLTTPIYAQGQPLIVGVESFSPPFLMQGANNEVYGFNIDMMNNLCKIMDRTCQYRVMPFTQLIPAVVNKKIDVALSAMTITANRAQLVNFSIPYFLSNSRFLAKKSMKLPIFTMALFNNKKIGIEAGSVFADEIRDLRIKDPVIKTYARTAELLEALESGAIDFALMDDQTALYWAHNSSDAFQTVGPGLNYGFGFGMAVNLTNKDLLTALNKALLQYQDSDDYKKAYAKYFTQF